MGFLKDLPIRYLVVALVFLASPCHALSCDLAWNYVACMYPIMRLDPSNPIMGINQYGDNAAFLNGVFLQQRFTDARAGNIQTMQVYAEPYSGGVNQSGGPKTNYSTLFGVMVARTPGQHTGVTSIASNFSNGDTNAFGGYAMSWGRNNAMGDEGAEGISVGAYQGNTVMTATVTGVASNVISYASPVNENTRGEGRPLIITTPTKVYSQGTITAVAGAPPVITGIGQDFTTLGTGPVSNLFMSLDTQVGSGLKLVVPIRSITDATHLVLDYMSEGVDGALPAATMPSTYKIFRGGNVTALTSQPGSMTVSSATDFAIGDTVEQPLGYSHALVGGHFTVAEYLPAGTNSGSVGVQIINVGPRSVRNGLVMSGAFDFGVEFTGPMTEGIRFDVNPSGALLRSNAFVAGATTNLLGVFDSAGQNAFMSYDRSVDMWKTTRPVSAPSFACAGVVGVNCNGPLSQTATIRCGIITSC